MDFLRLSCNAMVGRGCAVQFRGLYSIFLSMFILELYSCCLGRREKGKRLQNRVLGEYILGRGENWWLYNCWL